MNSLWYVLRVFYAVGLLFVVPLFLIAAFNFDQDREVASMILVCGVIYLLFGYLLFSAAPRYFRSRLDQQVTLLSPGFKPDFFVYSCKLDGYLGVDRKAGVVVFISRASGVQAQLEVPEIREWEVEPAGKNPALVKLSTAVAELPLVGFRFNWRESMALTSNLQATFG
jgi:hypothetical protein